MRRSRLLLLFVAILIGTVGAAPAQTGPAMKKGAIIGLVSGAVAFPVYEIARLERVCGPHRGTIHACDDEPRRSTVVFKWGSLGAAVGAAVGSAIGALIDRRHRTVAIRQRSKIAVTPWIGAKHKGVAVSVVF